MNDELFVSRNTQKEKPLPPEDVLKRAKFLIHEISKSSPKTTWLDVQTLDEYIANHLLYSASVNELVGYASTYTIPNAPQDIVDRHEYYAKRTQAHIRDAIEDAFHDAELNLNTIYEKIRKGEYLNEQEIREFYFKNVESPIRAAISDLHKNANNLSRETVIFANKFITMSDRYFLKSKREDLANLYKDKAAGRKNYQISISAYNVPQIRDASIYLMSSEERRKRMDDALDIEVPENLSEEEIRERKTKRETRAAALEAKRAMGSGSYVPYFLIHDYCRIEELNKITWLFTWGVAAVCEKVLHDMEMLLDIAGEDGYLTEDYAKFKGNMQKNLQNAMGYEFKDLSERYDIICWGYHIGSQSATLIPAFKRDVRWFNDDIEKYAYLYDKQTAAYATGLLYQLLSKFTAAWAQDIQFTPTQIIPGQ